MSGPTWNGKFYLIYLIYFKYIVKKHEKVTDNPAIRTIYVNKIENSITFKNY